ncbi:MAG TPA: DUF5678 domain-containing protein [Blastocatellia bacterium]|nr:DUF5678 domain-containing protein [Blastocatellia bacterium]
MSTMTAETIMEMIEQLPPTEQAKLEQLIVQHRTPKAKPPLDKRVPPKPLPDQAAMQRWIGEHAHEYPGEWIALDGDKLIAHGPNHQEVWEAAQASGAYLPLVTRLPSPDDLPFAGF